MRRAFDSETVERKWLDRWREAGVYAARRGGAGEPKFYLHFAYPGISGYLHVGHMRGFTYSDVFVRYKRMTGHRVFFPAGFHASGIPSVGLARRVERGEEAILNYLRANGTPEDVIARLSDPLEVVRYFSGVYADDYWRRFGFLINFDALCTTIDPGYHRFIQWQFRRLHERGLLVQKPHFGPFCPVDGAVAVDAAETDLSSGGDAEINDYTLVRFRAEDGTVFPCATLRPETTWGVTNLWVDPEGRYVKVGVGGESWVVAEPAAHKLRGLRDDVADPGSWEPVSTEVLLRASCSNPLTGAPVPVVAAPFVDPGRATGVVMSVPAHAPYDWIALQEARPDIEPIVIIANPKSKGVPAEEACRRHGVRSQADEAALDAATDEVYSAEFHQGRMNERCGPLAGKSVHEAKDAIGALLEAQNASGRFQDFNKDVVCRCGRPVYVRKIPDQWFIRYSDPDLTREAQEHVRERMRIFPEEYNRDMPAVLDWFGDRACVRKGSWLGTKFPLDESWIIEPISDSTFYSAYYVVSPYVNAGTLKPEDLDDAFFDYVFLGRGAAKAPVWDEARRDFEYWYPVDMNLGGKEHKTVHFPPYVMNHVALVPPEKRPRGIFVNWWVTQKAGEKISKSKGGAEPIPDAAKKYTVDGMRLYYANVASAHVDVEWDPETVLDARNRVLRIHQFVTDFADAEPGTSAEGVDAWLTQRWNDRLAAARAAFDGFDLRAASNQIYFEFYNDLQWWRRRGGRRSPAASDVVAAWVRALGPVTPFLAEELHEVLAGDGLVVDAAYPEAELAAEPSEALAREEFLRGVLDDLNNVVRVARVQTPSRVVVHTSPAWKRRAAATVREAVDRGERNPGAVIKQLLADPDLAAHKKDLPGFVQRAMKDAFKTADGAGARIDEYAVLESARDFLAAELGARVEVYRADDAQAPDPGGKRAVAAPGKPALFVE